MSEKRINQNALSRSSSPYLLQHANNPVHWYPWSEEALKKAKEEDKPILVSIGYSACHWCHVMERESFENEDIAAIMNEHLICIKVDREERPDVDQVYMDAVHAMGLQGGWPLNVFLLPDQRPFYGGTYFPPQSWAQICNQIGKAFQQQRPALEKSAAGFMKNLSVSEADKYGLTRTDSPFTKEKVEDFYKKFEEQFDLNKGGNARAPKFPMPVLYQFILRAGKLNKNHAALAHVERTLNHMAWGGIYDQIGGGFTRYATDMDWFVPHFEKMLYDNGQLVSLYSEAYQALKKPLYKSIVMQTIAWLEREMTSNEGGFYAALDADSEGEEGKYYLWTEEEIDDILGPDAEFIKQYYHIGQGNWEPGKNIPFRGGENKDFAQQQNMSVDELEDAIAAAHLRLLEVRNKRVAPGKDDKILAGWNGIMLQGLCDAYATFGHDKHLALALKNGQFLLNHMIDKGKLFRNFKNGQATIAAYLEDYAWTIRGFIGLYQITFDEAWLNEAHQLLTVCLEEFYDSNDGLFFFTSNAAEALITRKKEIFDNVIPSSNGVMARNLYDLGLYFEHEYFIETAVNMLKSMDRVLHIAPQDLAGWASFYADRTEPIAEIAMVTPKPTKCLPELHQQYHPNKILLGKTPGQATQLNLLKERDQLNDQATFYVCFEKTCQLPVHTIPEVHRLLKIQD